MTEEGRAKPRGLFTADVTLKSNGRRQAVVIAPQGGGDITRIDLELVRQG